MELVTCSPRNMSKLRGKAQHQFRCLEGVRPLLVGFDRFIGGPSSMYEWDKEAEIGPHLRSNMGFLCQQLPRLLEAGAEMWPMDPTTLYFRWSRGLPHPYGELIVATWDASVKGLAISLCERPGEILYLEGMHFEGVSTIVTFEDTPEAQVHREMAGAPMVMRLCRRHFDMRDRTVLMRNDCDPVIHALRKGSASLKMQAEVEVVCREAVETRTRMFFLHVPGKQLILEKVDGGSRAGAERLLGPSCTPWARGEIATLLGEHGWNLTLDLFAAGSNAQAARYTSWTDEPDSEQVDAFTLRSWAQSQCPGCKLYHRETMLIFPPRGLERAVVRRAKSDGVKACFIVPTSHKSGYWKVLRSAAIARLAFNDPKRAFALSQAPLAAHSVFLVDFGTADGTVPCCGQESRRRGRQPRWEPHEAAELEALKAAAQALG